jgi:molecular chaperone GrpE
MSPTSDPSDGRIQELEKQIAELTAKLESLTDLAGRAQADLQNARARMAKDAEELRRFASEEVLLKLLPTIDNFQRAFAQLPTDLKAHEWAKGVQAIEQDLLRQVQAMGLRKFESLGEPVDASRHEVLMTGEGEEGKVIEVFEDGYELHGRVVRPAKVKVGSAP